MNKLGLQIFDRVTEFIGSLHEDEQVRILEDIESIRLGDFEAVYIKTLRGPIKEFIVRRTRVIFCIENETLYALRAFTKKTMKTPRREIEMAERMYSLLLRQLGPGK